MPLFHAPTVVIVKSPLTLDEKSRETNVERGLQNHVEKQLAKEERAVKRSGTLCVSSIEKISGFLG